MPADSRPFGAPDDGRLTVLHGKAFRFLDLNQPFIYRTIKGLLPFYRNVIVAKRRENESVFPWTEVELFHHPMNTTHPDKVVPLAHRLVARYGMPAAALGHFGSGGTAIFRVTQVLDIPLVTIFGGVDIAVHCVQRPKERPAYQRLFRHGTLFLAVSKSLAQLAVERGSPPGRTFAWHRGIDLDDIPTPPRGPRHEGKGLRIIMVGRCDPKKGHVIGIRAFARLLKAHPDAQLRIIGDDGPETEKTQSVIQELGLGDRVILSGVIPHDEVIRHMLSADISLHPSITSELGDVEGLPNVLIEAHACGLPAVGTVHAGIPEVVRDGESGLLVPERDVDALAAALQRLADDEGLRRRFGACGQDHVRQEFDMWRQGRRLAAHLEHAMTLHRQRHLPLTLGIPPLPLKYARSTGWKKSRLKLNAPTDPGKLWAHYAGSHRRGLGKLIKVWKRLTYPVLLRPVVTLVAEIVKKLQRSFDRFAEGEAFEERAFVHDLFVQNIRLARQLEQLRRAQSGNGGDGDTDGLSMNVVACGQCPHCSSDALWPRRPCPLDGKCLDVLSQEYAMACGGTAAEEALSADKAVEFQTWLKGVGSNVARVSGAPAGEGAPDALRFADGRLEAEDGAFDGVAADLCGARKSALVGQVREIVRVVRPGGRVVLWVAPFGRSAWAGQALGMPNTPPYAAMIFGGDVLAGAGGAAPEPDDLAGARDLEAATKGLGLSAACWQPLYDPAVPAPLIARARPMLDGYDIQDLITLGVFCALDKPD